MDISLSKEDNHEDRTAQSPYQPEHGGATTIAVIGRISVITPWAGHTSSGYIDGF
jgi:hypothetical protein